jgi:sortase (surface protein transpeptidase)
MNWQGVALIVGIVGGILTVVGAIATYVIAINKMSFFAGQFLAKVDQMSLAFSKFERSFEDHMKEEAKQSKAMWEKLDTHGNTLVEHHQRIGFLEKNGNRKA